MKDKFENVLAYAFISFIYFLTLIYGIDNIKKLGKKITEKYEDEGGYKFSIE